MVEGIPGEKKGYAFFIRRLLGGGEIVPLFAFGVMALISAGPNKLFGARSCKGKRPIFPN